MKIVILIASLGGGGAERMAMRLARGLNDNENSTCLITIDNSRDYHGAEHSLALSFSKVSWPTPAKVIMAPWQKMRLKKYLQQFKTDVVISLMERANIMNLTQNQVPARILSIRTHSGMMMKAKSFLKRRLVISAYNRLLGKAKKIVCNSLEMKRDFEKIYKINPEKTAVIYNFCDMQRLHENAAQPLPAEMQHLFEKQVIITSGRLEPQKGQWHLIRAFKKISSEFDDMRLVILGKGQLKSALTDLCRDLKIEKKVFFPGFVQNPAAMIAMAKIFVLPSIWEGFPNALLEAMALGVPVIAADCKSGPRELLLPETDPEIKTDIPIETDCGMLVPPLPEYLPKHGQNKNDYSSRVLADSLMRMLDDKNQRAACGQASKKRAGDFTPDKILNRWRQLIKASRGGN